MPAHHNIGVRINDYRADVRRGLRLASGHKFNAVEIAVETSEIAPSNLSESGRRHLARLVAETGMTFASLAQGEQGRGLADPARVDEAVARMTQVLRLAGDMCVPVVAHDLGSLLGLSEREQDCAREALSALTRAAERAGTIYAIRSSPAEPAKVAALVRTLDSPLGRLCLDPGELLRAGQDPVQIAGEHGELVSLAYVRDALRGRAGMTGRETNLGEGSLDLEAYVVALRTRGYGAAAILRRPDGTDPAAAIAQAKSVWDARLS